MDEKLNQIYQDMVLNENQTVGTVKPGDLEGAAKNGKPIKQKTTPDNTVDSPKDGPSSQEVKKGGATKNAEKAGEPNKHESATMKFDALYKQILEAEDEIVPAEEVEGGEFSDDTGDFIGDEPSEDEIGAGENEEVDLGSELRLMAGRLNEIADKLFPPTGDEEGLGDEGMGEEGLGDEGLGGEGAMGGDTLSEESFKSQPEPKTAPKTKFGPKMSKTIGKLGSVGKKTAKTTTGGGSHTGELKKHDKKPKHGCIKAGGSGPAASGKNADAFVK